MNNTLTNIALVVLLLIIAMQIDFKEQEISIEKYELVEQWKKIHPELNSTILSTMQDGKILGKEYIEIEDEFKQLNREDVKNKLKE